MAHIQAWWRWLRGVPHELALLIVSLVFLCACATCSSGALLVGLNAGQFLPFGLQSALASPSMTQAGTRMMGDVATLGGTEDGFTAAYGAPAVTSAKGATYAFPAGSALGSINITFTSTQVGTTHVSSISLGIQLPSWDEDVADGLYAPFLPAGAQPVKDVRHGDYTEHVFRSANLAATFPARLFVDDHHEVLPPGTFDAYCESFGIGGGIGNCVVGLGTYSGAASPCSTPAADTQSLPMAIPIDTLTPSPTATPTPRPTATATPKSKPAASPTATPRSRSSPSSTPRPTVTPCT